MAYYFLYETTNLTNGKKYIGQHCTNDLNDGYFGSCKELKQDIKKGDNYRTDILRFFSNIFDLGDAEYEEIKRRDILKDPNFYNKYNGRYYNRYFENGRDKSYIDKMKGRIVDKTLFQKEKNGFYGKHHKKETKIKCGVKPEGWRAPNKGQKWAWIRKNKEQKMVLEKNLEGFLINGWERGRLSFKKNQDIYLNN